MSWPYSSHNCCVVIMVTSPNTDCTWKALTQWFQHQSLTPLFSYSNHKNQTSPMENEEAILENLDPKSQSIENDEVILENLDPSVL